MGKGDKKTRRGKITNRSYGVRRPKKKNNSAVPAPAAKKTAKAKPKASPPAKTKTAAATKPKTAPKAAEAKPAQKARAKKKVDDESE